MHEALSDVDREIKRGDITLITPTNPHKVRDIDSLIMFETEAIDDEMLNTILLKSANKFGRRLSERESAYALGILEYADTEFCQRNKNYERFMIDTVNQLLTM